MEDDSACAAQIILTPVVTLSSAEVAVSVSYPARGATAIEYSLIAGFIALAIIAAVGMTGQRLVTLFESLIPALTL